MKLLNKIKRKIDKKENISKAKKSSKRKTLFKDFDEIVKRGHEEEIKNVFKKCDINAYGGYDKTNALSFELSENLMRWLVENGANIEYEDRFGKRPLHHQVINPHGHPEYLIQLRANIEATDSWGNTPLFYATCFFRIDHMKILVESGARVNALNSNGETPLLKAMKYTKNGNIPDLVKIVHYLLEHGARLTRKEKEEVKRIGEDFEWFRDCISKDSIGEIEENLMELYRLFKVEPVPKRIIYDGKSKIRVKAKQWQDQHEELWKLLVPTLGHASTIQGEVIRISGKLSYEINHNGRINWNKEFKKMADSLLTYCCCGYQLSQIEIEELKKIVHNINHIQEDDLDKLTQLCVKWVLLNPYPLSLDHVDYNR